MADRSLTLGTLFSANATQFVQTINLLKKKVGELNATFASVGKKGAKGMNAASKSVDKLGKSMDGASKKADQHKKSLRGVAGAFDRIKTAAKITASFAAAAAVIATVSRAFGEGVKEIIDYDQGLKNLQAITNATDAEVKGMGETIKKVARTTKFSTGEVAEGMTLLGQAGFSAVEAMQAMNSVAELATGTLSSMQFTADLMTTTIRAFGMSTVESAKAADIMANAINRSKLTIDKLRIAFNFVGAASHQAGLTLEETAASMMVLANQGFRASTIGTGLRQVLARLLAPTGKLREEFEAAGIELNKVNPSLVGFRTALENLLPVLYNSADGTINMAKAYRLFGLRGAQAAAVLASSIASGNYDRMLELTYETGTAARMAAKQAEGLALILKNLADRARLVAVALGEGGLIGGISAVGNALKVLVTGIENFIRSTIGGIVVAFTGWVTSIWLVTKVLRGLGIAILSASTFIVNLTRMVWALVTANTALAARMTAAGGATGLFAKALKGANGWVLLVTVGVAGLVTGIRYLLSATDRRIKALREEQNKTLTLVQTLKLNIAVLDELAKKQKKGNDISKEHGRLVRRMKSDVEELVPALREEAKYLELNREQLETMYSVELRRAIIAQINLIGEYSKSVEEASIKSGLLNMTTITIRESFQNWFNTLIQNLTFLPKLFDTFITKMAEWLSKIEGFGLLGDLFRELGTVIGDTWENTKKVYHDWVVSYGKDSDEVREKTEQVNKGFVKLAILLNDQYKGKKPLKDIIEETKKLYKVLKGGDIEVGPKLFSAIERALGDVTLKLKKEQEEWKSTIDELPVLFQEMYKDMDGLRKADFAKVVKSMQAELAAFEKVRVQMGITDEESNKARAAIRARHLGKFAVDMKKEVEVTKEAAEEMTKIHEIQEAGIRELYHKRTASMIEHYMKRRELVRGDKGKELELEKKFNAQIKKEQEKLDGDLRQIVIRRNELTLQMQKQMMGKVKELHKKIFEDLKKQLQSQYDTIKGERDDLLKSLKSLDESYVDTLRTLRQKTMTDEEKYNDDLTYAHELLNEARAKGDMELYKKASALVATLAREVTDENGKTIKSLTDAASEAEDLFIQIHNEMTGLIKKGVDEKERSMRDLKAVIKSVDDQAKEFAKTLDWLNTKELAIKADETIKALSEVYNINHNFKTEWDALHDKTITLTVKYNYVGKKSGGGGGEESTGEGGGESTGGGGDSSGGATESRYGGLIQKMMEFGGKLAGYGGGDKVRARLEPGEFVIRKEAVKKYGGQIFDSLNKMNAPDVVSSVGKRLGGMIGNTIRGFKTGGLAPAHASMSANQQTFHITLKPKYLTGDRQAMRSMAKDVTQAIEEQSKRWGRK